MEEFVIIIGTTGSGQPMAGRVRIDTFLHRVREAYPTVIFRLMMTPGADDEFQIYPVLGAITETPDHEEERVAVPIPRERVEQIGTVVYRLFQESRACALH